MHQDYLKKKIIAKETWNKDLLNNLMEGKIKKMVNVHACIM